jgi:hypothetical protein
VGGSLIASSSGRPSFSTTSAARCTRLPASPVTILAKVRGEHGAMTIPSVRNEPLEIRAAWLAGW